MSQPFVDGYRDVTRRNAKLPSAVVAQFDVWIEHMLALPMSKFHTSQELPKGAWLGVVLANKRLCIVDNTTSAVSSLSRLSFGSEAKYWIQLAD